MGAVLLTVDMLWGGKDGPNFGVGMRSEIWLRWTLTIFSAIVGAVKSMHVNGVSTRPPALPLAILDGRLENQVPPSLEALLTAAAPLSEALLSNSDISSSSYVKVNQGVAAVRLVGRPSLPKIVLSWSVGHKWRWVFDFDFQWHRSTLKIVLDYETAK